MHNCALDWVAFPREFAPLWEASRHEKSQYTVVPTSKEFSSCYYATIQATWQATHFTAVLPGFNVYSTDAAAVLRPKGKSSKNRKPWNVNERCVHDVRVSFFSLHSPPLHFRSREGNKLDFDCAILSSVHTHLTKSKTFTIFPVQFLFPLSAAHQFFSIFFGLIDWHPMHFRSRKWKA